MVEAGEVIIGICFVITFAVCALRFYLRVIVARQFTLMEFCLPVALAAEIIFGSLQLKMFRVLAAPPTPENGALIGKLFFSATFFYFASLWSVKISINMLHLRLTQRLPGVHAWAQRSIYFLVATFIFINVTYPFGCWPTSRRWDAALGKAKACPAILREWDFWTHLAIHLLTDIYLCILPFPALIRIGERRLRVAICGVYSLAGISIIVSAVRAALLGVNPQSNIKYIMCLTIVEVATCIVVGCVPCMSSTFTRKYVYSSKDSSPNASYKRGTGPYRNRVEREDGAEERLDLVHLKPVHYAVSKEGIVGAAYST